ncbi:MAG: MBL fold metallo-hydrolase [Candidatus Latescibacterota bacterium]|nr:MAG: MBL fold metallo-hydrolase [Candidatus Latescibacterota bacterium]
MRVDTLTVGMFQSNCFVVSCGKTKKGLVIDAGDEGDRIVEHVEGLGLKIEMIIATHGHIDHVAALPDLASAFSVPIGMHENELPVYQNIRQQAALFGLEPPGIVEIGKFLSDGDTITVGELTGEVIHTPGHSPGGISISFAEENPPAIFAGDVLFRGSIGRTDLMGASSRQMFDTLKTVFLKLPDDVVVYSGHGPETTIGFERRTNPFLLEASQWGL